MLTAISVATTVATGVGMLIGLAIRPLWNRTKHIGSGVQDSNTMDDTNTEEDTNTIDNTNTEEDTNTMDNTNTEEDTTTMKDINTRKGTNRLYHSYDLYSTN